MTMETNKHDRNIKIQPASERRSNQTIHGEAARILKKPKTGTQEEEQYENHEPDTMGRLLEEWMETYNEEAWKEAQEHTTDTSSREDDSGDNENQQTLHQKQDAAKQGKKKKQADHPRRSQEEAEKAEATNKQEEEQYGKNGMVTLEQLPGEWMKHHIEEA